MSLRVALGVGGVIGLVAASAWAAVTHPSVSPAHVAIFVVAAVSVLVGAIPRLPGRPLVAIVIALVAYLLATWTCTAVVFPSVDLVRGWGIEKGAWPVFRPMLGLLLIAAGLPAGLAGRRLGRLLGLIGCGVVLTWAVIPRWYEMDVVEQAGILPNGPETARGPGVVGPGDTPIVRHGVLEHIHWTRYLYQGAPLRRVGVVAYRERVVADLAHGMMAEMSRDATAAQHAVRGALWGIAKVASTVRLYAEALSVPVWAWVAGRLLVGRRAGITEARVLRLLVLGQLLLVPAVNLGLTLVGLALLPETARGGLWMLGLVSTLGGVVGVVAIAGRDLARVVV